MRPGAGHRRPGRDGVAAAARTRGVGDERPRPRARGAVHAAREPDRGGDRDPGRAAADAGFAGDEPDRPALALGALLAGHALGLTGFALHHVLSQTIVRTTGAPHGAVNAVMLPHVAAFMQPRAPRELALFDDAVDVDRLRPRGRHDGPRRPRHRPRRAARDREGDRGPPRRPRRHARRRASRSPTCRRCSTPPTDAPLRIRARRRRTMRGVERMRAVVLGRDGDDGAARRARAATARRRDPGPRHRRRPLRLRRREARRRHRRRGLGARPRAGRRRRGRRAARRHPGRARPPRAVRRVRATASRATRRCCPQYLATGLRPGGFAELLVAPASHVGDGRAAAARRRLRPRRRRSSSRSAASSAAPRGCRAGTAWSPAAARSAGCSLRVLARPRRQRARARRRRRPAGGRGRRRLRARRRPTSSSTSPS